MRIGKDRKLKAIGTNSVRSISRWGIFLFKFINLDEPLTREEIILQHVLALGNETIVLAGQCQYSCPALARKLRDVVTVHLGASHQHTRLRASAL